MKHWGEKRFYSLDYYIKQTFGEKLYKISLDGGMTCPNRDGSLSTGGCTFCSEGGSGDFASSNRLSITDQITEGKNRVCRKIKDTQGTGQYIAYFQAYTNTYAPVAYLERIFTEAINSQRTSAGNRYLRPQDSSCRRYSHNRSDGNRTRKHIPLPKHLNSPADGTHSGLRPHHRLSAGNRPPCSTFPPQEQDNRRPRGSHDPDRIQT